MRFLKALHGNLRASRIQSNVVAEIVELMQHMYKIISNDDDALFGTGHNLPELAHFACGLRKESYSSDMTRSVPCSRKAGRLSRNLRT
jgi:hypothetical protein